MVNIKDNNYNAWHSTAESKIIGPCFQESTELDFDRDILKTHLISLWPGCLLINEPIYYED